MTEVFQRFNANGVRYVLIGGQAMRLLGMPRYSLDWDFFVPPHDENNFNKINECLGDELDLSVVPLGPGGENFIQTYQTKWGVLQFHLLVAGLPRFDEVEQSSIRHVLSDGTKVTCLAGRLLLASKEAANRPQDLRDIKFLRELARLGKI